MPNTLAHIGVQLPLSRFVSWKIDPRWIALGLLIPDLPWIYQRILKTAAPGLSHIDIRAYMVVLSVPVFCFLLAGSVSLLFRGSKWIFLTLAFQILFHLILDSLQEKGGVGVFLLGPFNWNYSSWPIFSMDGWVSGLMTLNGAITTFLILAGKIRYNEIHIQPPVQKWRYFASAILLLAYALGPMWLTKGAIEANVHDLKLWSGAIPRTGMQVHFDRAQYEPGETMGIGSISDTFKSGAVKIEGIQIDHPALISTVATFRDESTLITSSYVVHPKGRRFWYSISGLACVLFIWVYPGFQRIPVLQRMKNADQGPKTTR